MPGRGTTAEPQARRLWFRRACARLLAIALAAASAATILPAPRASAAGIRRVGTLDRRSGQDSIAANGNLLVDSAARRGWQAASREGRMLLYEVNLDTLALLSTTEIPELFPAATSLGPTEWQWTIDEPSRRIFAVARVYDARTRLEGHTLLTIDLRTRTTTMSDFFWLGGTRLPLAIQYHRLSGRIYLLSRTPEAASRARLWVEERTLDGMQTWEHALGDCANAMDMQYAPVVARSILQPGKLYATCYGAGNVQAQVIRLTLGGSGVTGEEVFPAVPGPLSAKFDPGSDRVFFLTVNGGAGRGAWVFDGLRSSFLGVIASGDARAGAVDYAMGLDPESGRLYMETPAGFLVADARRTPLPSGLLFRDLAGQTTGTIHVDPRSRRVFVPDPYTKNPQGQATQYLVLEDSIRVSKDPPAGDPDALTTDIAETPGRTAVNFSGGARAFALRSLTTGGAQRMAWNLTLGPFSPEDAFFSTIDGGVKTVPLDASNREMYAARVRQVSLSNQSADASATFAETDGGTARDLAKAGQRSPVQDAECHDEAATPRTTNGTASASSCDRAAASVTASSALAGSARDDGALIASRSLVAFSSLQRNDRDGLVATSTAIVHDLTIGNSVTIGEIRADARANAKGRRGSASGSFTRTIRNVLVDTDHDGTPEFSCASCEPQVVAAAIREALPGQVAVEFPAPDPAYVNGSTGGYQAVVQKDTFRGYAERALNEDDAPEVVAMQIVYFADARAGRSRHVVQVAGVQAESHYGIYSTSDTSHAEPECPGPACPEDAPPPVVLVPSEPVVSTPEAAPPPAPTPKTVTERVLRRFAAGTQIALAKPRDGLLLGVLWAFLALPGYLILRRRHIGSRPR